MNLLEIPVFRRFIIHVVEIITGRENEKQYLFQDDISFQISMIQGKF